MQVACCLLSKISLSDLEGGTRRICQTTSVSTVSAKGTGSGAGDECAARPCASSRGDTAKVCSVRIHGLAER